ncbi:ATP-binding cassette domain-containing protein [Euzebya tangerina]|uniref:ATP-binding cassette domain-containing protein n=1 Tax=Euzebya tangerina TaxID=591198 RepID=UPI000E321E5D|nr:ATP-binding cassette domain-containing protein [Euzebya tangerina]
MTATGTAVAVDAVTVRYDSGAAAVTPLEDFSVQVRPGELAILLGPSGCGKSTLLSIIGGMRSATSGSIRVGDAELTAMTALQLDVFRHDQVGYVFRRSNLVPSLSAVENVAVPLLVKGVPRRDALASATSVMERVELLSLLDRRPDELSSGQKRRVSVARALIADPPLLLADEPTARLDHIGAQTMITLLQSLASDGRTVIVATHDPRFVPVADQTVHMVPDLSSSMGAPTTVTFDPGETIFWQGSRGDRVYVLESGEVEVLNQLADGSEELITAVGAPGHVGAVSPRLGFPRASTARARTAVRAISYSVVDFEKLQSAQVETASSDDEPTIVAAPAEEAPAVVPPPSEELPTLVAEPSAAADETGSPDVPPPPP